MKQKKFILSEKQMPTAWYNVLPDLPKPLPPPLHPGTGKPLTPPDLAPLFPMELIKQEMSNERFIDIPEEVQEIFSIWRPSPLVRAYQLEKALDTPAKIFYKNESVSPAGSHKPNTAIAQAYYNKKEGIKRLTTETGAGQWGSALSLACNYFGLECKVYMVRSSYYQKPYRRSMMQTWGAKCIPSPSTETKAGRDVLARDPETPGTLGIAISEAVEEALGDETAHYALGSVLNHVVLHQTVIGLETIKQMEMADAYPDVIIGCVGGGSNFGGMAIPFLPEKLKGKKIQIIAVEAESCPHMTKGVYAYDFGDEAGLTPLLKMTTLGHTYVPPPVHAGGLRYHGMSPLISHLYQLKLIEARAVHQTDVFDSAVQFARTEGLIPAPESAHAIKVLIDEAIACKKSGKGKTLLLNLSGHGHFDMTAYDAYFSNKLENYSYPAEKVKEALTHLPKV